MTLLPEKFISRLTAQIGETEVKDYLSSFNEPLPTSIRINPAKPFEHEYTNAIDWSDNSYWIEKKEGFQLNPLYHQGRFYPQDASTLYIQHLIKDINKPILALDLCAAPGGKTLLIHDILPKDSVIISNEIDGIRNSILKENVVKWGCENVIITRYNAEAFKEIGLTFDLILVDAPCSGEGMFRKDDFAIEQWNAKLLDKCEYTQRNLLNIAIDLLNPGGILIYSTCTFNPKENEKHLENLIKTNRELESIGIEEEYTSNLLERSLNKGNKDYKYFYSFPQKSKGEGQFFFGLRRLDKTGRNDYRNINKIETSSTESFLISNTYKSFTFNNILLQASEDLIDYLSILPLKGIKYAGIETGTLDKRKELIPAHHLYMLKAIPSYLGEIYEINKDDALKYLTLETQFKTIEMADGRGVFSYESCGLGGFKKSGNKISNNYPKNWKIRNLKSKY
jgi:16S rRNA C967 or C1407 C5-methylase (RsmB/RsmF family)